MYESVLLLGVPLVYLIKSSTKNRIAYAYETKNYCKRKFHQLEEFCIYGKGVSNFISIGVGVGTQFVIG